MQIVPFSFLFALGALTFAGPAHAQTSTDASSSAQGEVGGFDLSLPDGVPEAVFSGSRRQDVLAVQAMLDRSRHSPGVIDGYMGGNTRRAIRYYREANGLPPGEELDARLIRALIEAKTGDVFSTYTITPADVEGPFYEVPSDMAAMAELDRVGWRSPREKLADRFHMDEDFLAALNPDADFGSAGTQIAVISHGDEALAGDVDRIEIRKADNSVVALDSAGTVLASYPATIGSSQFPSPSGTMQVAAVAPEANYTFDPDGREWGPDQTLIIPPGPNNPVGGIWIDLSKDGYGIHGSPDPQLIGKTASHGCVRLTNWDAQELAAAVSQGVTVAFR